MKLKKNNLIMTLLTVLTIGAWTSVAIADDDLRNDGNNLVEEFDWQDEWGSVHINSLADGLADPGHSGGRDLSGIVSCPRGVICSDPNVHGSGKVEIPPMVGGQLFNSVKYDIKNSIVNCMSRPSPNFPSGNGGWKNIFSKFVCKNADSSLNLDAEELYEGSHPTIVYSPIWDPRSNDERANSSDGQPGCIQQIANNCIDDIHGCWKHPKAKTKGWRDPVGHVFSEDEIDQLQDNGGLNGNALPRKYYRYLKALDMGSLSWSNSMPSGKYVKRVVSGATQYASIPDNSDPANPDKQQWQLATRDDRADQVYEDGDAKITTINTYDHNLKRIRTFTINPGSAITDPRTINGFMIVDPSEFFDLRLYVDGGAFDSDYRQMSTYANPDIPLSEYDESNPDHKLTGPMTFDTCPIKGLNMGYEGICDPTGKAGCNLPIYGVGNTTTTNAGGKSWENTHTPIIWSGYVKSWKFISQSDYTRLTEDRRGPNGEKLYLYNSDEERNLNGSAVFVAERHKSYCDAMEIFDGYSSDGEVKELDKCIQYFQYQKFMVPKEDDPEVLEEKWSFFNLFAPEMKAGYTGDRGFAYLNMFHEMELTKVDPVTGVETVHIMPYIWDEFDIYSSGSNPSVTGSDGKVMARKEDGSVDVASSQMVPIWCDAAGSGQAYKCGLAGTHAKYKRNYVELDMLDDGDSDMIGRTFADGGKRLVSWMDVATPKRYTIKVRQEADGTRSLSSVSMIPNNDSNEHRQAIHYAVDYEDPNIPSRGGDTPPTNTKGEQAIGMPIKDSKGNAAEGLHLKLKPGTSVAIRYKRLEREEMFPGEEEDINEMGEEYIDPTRCSIATNRNMDMNPDANGYFIPTNSREEVASFFKANVESEDGKEMISFRPCKAQFAQRSHKHILKRNRITKTPNKNPQIKSWFGTTSCDQLATRPACNQSQIIVAERVCILEDGKMGDCNDCLEAANAAVDDGKILTSQAPDGEDDLSRLPSAFNADIGGIVLASASQCYFSALCLAQSSDAGCPEAATSGGHVFCLSADTKIDMADGSKKEIANIKDGEFVMAFSAEGSKSELIKAKVVATTITENERYFNLVTKDQDGNESTVKITGEHKVILSIGRAVQVKDLRRGIVILDRNGKHVEVQSVEEAEERIDVYNLILEEKADGYIAGGLRVQSYPLNSELKDAMQIK